MNEFKSDNSYIKRDGFVYEKFKNNKQGNYVYRCEDFFRLGCKGWWVLVEETEGADFGK